MQAIPCYNCGQLLIKDVIALNRKLLGRSIKRFLCLKCLAEYFNCTEEDLRRKIEEFKEQGCSLFA